MVIDVVSYYRAAPSSPSPRCGWWSLMWFLTTERLPAHHHQGVDDGHWCFLLQSGSQLTITKVWMMVIDMVSYYRAAPSSPSPRCGWWSLIWFLTTERLPAHHHQWPAGGSVPCWRHHHRHMGQYGAGGGEAETSAGFPWLPGDSQGELVPLVSVNCMFVQGVSECWFVSSVVKCHWQQVFTSVLQGGLVALVLYQVSHWMGLCH